MKFSNFPLLLRLPPCIESSQLDIESHTTQFLQCMFYVLFTLWYNKRDICCEICWVFSWPANACILTINVNKIHCINSVHDELDCVCCGTPSVVVNICVAWFLHITAEKFLDQELISYPYWYCSCWGDLFKKAYSFVILNLIRMKFGRKVLRVNTRRLTQSDFWFDITLSRSRPLRHFMQKSAATWWVQRLPGTCAAASASSWSIVRL